MYIYIKIYWIFIMNMLKIFSIEKINSILLILKLYYYLNIINNFLFYSNIKKYYNSRENKWNYSIIKNT